MRKDGSVVWRVRWRQAGRNRSKVLGRKRDAEAFDAEITQAHRRARAAGCGQGAARGLRRGVVAAPCGAEPRPVDAQGYASIWDAHVLPRLGSIPLRELTPDVVNRFRLELEADGVGPAAIRKALVLLQGVLQRACEWGRLASNPAAIVRKPVPPRARTIVPLAPERVEAIRFGLLGCGRIRDATLVSVLAYAGLRPGGGHVFKTNIRWPKPSLPHAAPRLQGTVHPRRRTRRRRSVECRDHLASDARRSLRGPAYN